MDRRRTSCTIAASALLLCAACQRGSARDDAAGDDAGDGSEDTASGDGSSGDPPAVGCDGLRPVRSPLRRLTDVQYRNTIDALFGGAIAASDDFPATSLGYEYTTEAAADEITELAVEQVMIAAEDVAEQVMAAGESVLGCAPSRSCAEAFVDAVAPRAFRHPLGDDERAVLLAAYDDGAVESPVDGIGRLVTAMLQMPQFVYLVEAGERLQDDASVTRLSDHEIASRLSYLLWDSPPDDELWGLAEAGTLGDGETLREQASRLLSDPRARAALGRFHREWLELPAVRDIDKDPAFYPEFDEGLLTAMVEQFDRVVASGFTSDDSTLAHLLTQTTVPIDDRLAPIYGVSPPGDWQDHAIDAAQRAGVLTLPLVLTGHATQLGSSTTHRGKMVRTRLFCQEIPPPPPGAAAQAPELPADATERERAQALLDNPQCGGCHSQMDGIGFGFEHFDAIGRWRDSYASGAPVDASGVLVSPPPGIAEGDFVGAVELASRLAESDEIAGCYARHFTHHAHAAAPTTAVEQCAAEDLAARFVEAGGDLPTLVAELVASDGFRYRDLGEDP
ncbi:MAG: DUF1592 domain-containing protein [Nannocystaceae bacterium]|nr:DUF1592 domain-containing protein [Nannocystaceae bacterium]